MVQQYSHIRYTSVLFVFRLTPSIKSCSGFSLWWAGDPASDALLLPTAASTLLGIQPALIWLPWCCPLTGPSTASHRRSMVRGTAFTRGDMCVACTGIHWDPLRGSLGNEVQCPKFRTTPLMSSCRRPPGQWDIRPPAHPVHQDQRPAEDDRVCMEASRSLLVGGSSWTQSRLPLPVSVLSAGGSQTVTCVSPGPLGRWL